MKLGLLPPVASAASASNGVSKLARCLYIYCCSSYRPFASKQRELLCRLRRSLDFHGYEVLQAGAKRLEGHWSTCAVVSNSGVLLLHEHGAEIDRADLVIRINDAPISAYKANVGSRDELRFVSDLFPSRGKQQEILNFSVQTNASYAIVPFHRPAMLEKFRAKHPSTEFYLLNRSTPDTLIKALHAIYTDEWFHAGRYPGKVGYPTSGSVGFIFALHICDEVHGYGFAQTPNAKRASYHYFGVDDLHNTDASDNSDHMTFDAEKDLWRQIATNSKQSIDETDKVVVTGFSRVACGMQR